jgi:type I restriction enzyme S subunit
MTDRMHSAKTLVGYKRYTAGQLVMNRMQAWSGMFGACEIDGLVSPDYAVFDVIGGHAVGLVLERLKAFDLVGQFALESKGIGSGFNRLYTDRFGPVPITLPPPDEQAAIVRFMDWTKGRLERAIRAKRKVISLLNEQKQAVIDRTVTRGLDPSRALKPSGIPWLGDIAQHWEVRALKRVVATKITDGPHETPELIDGGVDFMSAESMVDGRLVFERRRGFISRELHEQYCVKCLPQRDDVFMCKSGATTGKVAIVETDRDFSVWSPLALLRANKKVVLPRFLFVSLQTTYVQQQVRERWSFGTQPNLSMGAMGRILIAVPTVPEQEAALRQIEEASTPLTAATSRLEREIALLREYQTRLVADVVTGKLDVREAAARLPDEAPLDTVEESADLGDEIEAADEEAGA